MKLWFTIVVENKNLSPSFYVYSVYAQSALNLRSVCAQSTFSLRSVYAQSTLSLRSAYAQFTLSLRSVYAQSALSKNFLFFCCCKPVPNNNQTLYTPSWKPIICLAQQRWLPKGELATLHRDSRGLYAFTDSLIHSSLAQKILFLLCHRIGTTSAQQQQQQQKDSEWNNNYLVEFMVLYLNFLSS